MTDYDPDQMAHSEAIFMLRKGLKHGEVPEKYEPAIERCREAFGETLMEALNDIPPEKRAGKYRPTHSDADPSGRVKVYLSCENPDCDVKRGARIDLEGRQMSEASCHGCGELLTIREAGRTEEQERVEEALEWLEVNAKFGTLGHTAEANAKAVRDHLTRLREQKAELERAAREARSEIVREIREQDLPAAAVTWLADLRTRLDAALDESEGRGGGEDCDECGHPLDEHGYSGCARCGCDHDALPGLVGPTPQPGHYFESGDTTYYCPNCNAATPDPSEGEVGCDHENTVLDDNVEWCPDCRRVMPEDAEDAEDAGGEVEGSE